MQFDHQKRALIACLTSEQSVLLEQEPMKRHTTFRVGGSARFFAIPATEGDLCNLLQTAKTLELEVYLLGNGSNLLVSDAGVDGLVIATEGLCELSRAEDAVYAGAGCSLARIGAFAREESLTGMEALSGIPGTVGGAVVMNAGAYGTELKDVLEWARVLDENGEILTVTGEDLALGYRTSCVDEKGWIVLGAKFRLTPGDSEAIRARMAELSASRREKQPLNYPSAGSTFKRPTGYFAGKLIQDAGLKGFCVGGAQVSEKHSGFVINKGDATAKDIMQLCQAIREKVRADFGVELEMEVRRWGSFD